MKRSLIISRYNEDLNWLHEITDFDKIIYNKGEELLDNKFEKVISLPNVGRESHTWLFHIVNNFNCLAEDNIFLQGRIDDLGCMAHQDPNKYMKDLNKYGFSTSRSGLLGPFHWKMNVGIEKNSKYAKEWERNEIGRSNLGFRKFAKNLFPEIPIFLVTSYGGCFAVKKDLIRIHDLNFYKNLLDILSSHKNPIEGHYLERLWCYMFTKNRPFWRSIKDVFLTKYERILLKK